MKEFDLNQLINNPQIIEDKLREFSEKNILNKQRIDQEEIKGHLLKSEHDLRFIAENMKLKFFDWSITGCYYACYHAALALILTKGYTSKNHLATLCVLIKEFFKKELNKEDIELLFQFLDYQDVLFYVETKNKRELASYSTKISFNKKEVEKLRVKTILFIDKIKQIINQN